MNNYNLCSYIYTVLFALPLPVTFNRGDGSGVQPNKAARFTGLYIFFNFVTFSTKQGSTLDKAYSRLLGSRCVHANAHRRQ